MTCRLSASTDGNTVRQQRDTDAVPPVYLGGDGREITSCSAPTWVTIALHRGCEVRDGEELRRRRPVVLQQASSGQKACRSRSRSPETRSPTAM
jgi:hypothetical protein